MAANEQAWRQQHWQQDSNGGKTTRPKVLIVIATDHIGGPGKGLFQFLKHAPTEAFDYVLCNFRVKNKADGQFIEEARRRNLNLILLDQRTIIDPRLVLQARRIVLEHGIHVIQTHGYKSNVLGILLQTLCRRPWIGFAHGYTGDNRKVRLYNRIDRTVLRYADRVVTVSDSMKALLVRGGVQTENIRLIYNAIEVPPARPTVNAAVVKKRHGLAPDQRVIGVFGRLSPEKGQLVFLKAMAKTVQSCPGVIALLVGEGQDQAMLQDYCRANDLCDRVVFTGYQENVGEYYQVLDLLVLPSLSEGLPNAVLEAMSFGVPVVATAVGGVPEVITEEKNNGVLVPPGDPDALAQQIVELLKDDSRRQRIGQHGRRSLYPRFSPDQRARKIEGLYYELWSPPL